MLSTLTDALAAQSLSEFRVKRDQYGYRVIVPVPYAWLVDWRVQFEHPDVPFVFYWAPQLETAFVGAATLLGSVAEEVAQRVDTQAG